MIQSNAEITYSTGSHSKSSHAYLLDIRASQATVGRLRRFPHYANPKPLSRRRSSLKNILREAIAKFARARSSVDQPGLESHFNARELRSDMVGTAVLVLEEGAEFRRDLGPRHTVHAQIRQ
jgi:hypothetical protein